MLEKIIDLAKGYIQDSVNEKTNLPEEKKEAVSDTIVDSLKQNLQQEFNSGDDISKLTNLFNHETNSSFYKNMESSVINSLVSKVGLNSQLANNLASSILPGLISFITKKMGGNNIMGGLLGKLGL